MDENSTINARLLDTQDANWSRGRYSSVEELLAQYKEADVSSSDILELIWNERLLRGQLTPEQEFSYFRQEYCRRFAALADEINLDFDVERAADEFCNVRENLAVEQLNSAAGECVDAPRLPNYSVTLRFDSGAFGTVFKARQLVPDREVAIKLLNSTQRLPWSTDGVHIEAERIVRLRHRNIIEIYEVGLWRDFPYYTMPFIGSGSLQHQADQFNGRFEAIARLLIQVAEAVEYAHQLNVLHCDIKPSNILIDGDRPYLADFGLAVGQEERGILHARGTPAYMAPEQDSQSGLELDERTDIYGLGAVLYHLLTGGPPGFPADQPLIAPYSVNPRTPLDLNAICLKCLSFNPNDRYESATDFRDDLRSFIERRPVQARPLTGWLTPLRMTMWARRAPWAAAFCGVVALSFCGLTIQNGRLRTTLADAELQRDNAADTLFDHGNLAAERATKPLAAEQLRRSVAIYETLSEQNPQQIAYRFKLAIARQNLALLETDLGNREIGRSLLELARKELNSIALLSNSPKRTFDELANVHANSGNLFIHLHDVESGMKEYRMADQIRGRLLVETPTDISRRFAVAKSKLDLSFGLSEDSGNVSQAIELGQLAITSLRELLDDIHQSESLATDNPIKSSDVAFRLQQAIMNLGYLLMGSNRTAEAKQLYLAAEAQWQRLLAVDPTVSEYGRFHAATLSNLGTCCLSEGQIDEAIARLQSAESEFRQVIKEEGVSFRGNIQFGTCQLELASAYFLQNRQVPKKATLQQAKASAESAHNLFNRLAALEPDAAELSVDIANTEKLLGDIAFDESAYQPETRKKAFEHYEKAADLYAQLQRPVLKTRLKELSLLNNMGRLFSDSGQHKQANEYLRNGIEKAKQLLKENPNHALTRECLLALHDGKGVVAFQQWGQMAPVDQLAAAGLASLNEVLTHLDQAIRVGGGINPNQMTAHSSTILRGAKARRSLVLERLGKFDEAIAQWQKLFAEAPGSETERYRVFLAVAHAKSGDYRSAEAEIERFRPYSGSLTDGQYNLACAYASICKSISADATLTTDERSRLYGAALEQALVTLKRAKDDGFFQSPQNREALSLDQDLDTIRNEADFKTFIESLNQK